MIKDEKTGQDTRVEATKREQINKNNRDNRSKLKDSYLVGLISRQTGISRSEIRELYPDLIEEKREEILDYREIKSLTKQLKAQS